MADDAPRCVHSERECIHGRARGGPACGKRRERNRDDPHARADQKGAAQQHGATLYTHMKRHLAGVALTSATLLMTELALTRIFSVVMYYHFAFLAISIALFGLSASGVFAFTFRKTLDRFSTDALLATESLIYAVCTLVALFFLVRLRIGLTYSRQNLILMLTI